MLNTPEEEVCVLFCKQLINAHHGAAGMTAWLSRKLCFERKRHSAHRTHTWVHGEPSLREWGLSQAWPRGTHMRVSYMASQGTTRRLPQGSRLRDN